MGLDIEGRKFGVVGMARSGIAVTRFLRDRGARVLATDANPLSKLSAEVGLLGEEGVELKLNDRAYEGLESCDVVVTSPGVPSDSPPLCRAREAGVPVIGEIELAYHFCPSVLVAITGTKGKTTTATLLGEMLNADGIPAYVAGNIGQPLIGIVVEASEKHVIVAEVSSFQLETTWQFRPHVGVLLNIAEDHMNRYRDLDSYASAKERLFRNQQEDDFAIYNVDDSEALKRSASLRGKLIGFSTRRAVGQGVFVNGQEQLRSAMCHREGTICSRREILIPGPHNVGNALAASAAALTLGCSRDAIAEVLRTFSGVPNRLEKVAEINGVLFVNDSQATIPFAVEAGLRAFDRPVHLIAGGQSKILKTDSFDDFGRVVAQRCASLTCIGESAKIIAGASERGGMKEVHFAETLEQATRDAFSRSRPGDIVLLSPACASFDMFRNYEHRGEVFRSSVAQIAEKTAEN